MFEDEVVGQPSDEVSQDKIVAAHGGQAWPTEILLNMNGPCNM